MPIIIERLSLGMGSRPHQLDIPFAKPPEASETKPEDEIVTLEQWVLKTCREKSLADLPSPVIQDVIAIDAFNYSLKPKKRLSVEDMKSLFAYSLYELDDGNLGYLKKYTKVTEPLKIDALLDPVWDSETLTNAYNEVGDLKELLAGKFSFPFSRTDMDRRKKIARRVARAKAWKITDEQITARRGEIISKTNPNRLNT